MSLFKNNNEKKSHSSQEASRKNEKEEQQKAIEKQEKDVDLQTLLGSGKNNFEVSSRTRKDNIDNQEQRFVSVKYKVYTLIVLSIGIILYGPILHGFENTINKRNRGSELSKTIEQRIEDQKVYQETTNFIKKIENNKQNIISCFNIGENCEEIEEEINEHKDAVRGYLQIGELHKDKMDIDENKILRSINEFLLESAESTLEHRSYNGMVNHILIGNKQELENNIIKVPVDLMITFDSQENVIDFLKNLEERVFYTQEDGLNGSILYMINKINYDIVNYTDAQDVSVSLDAYAYNEK